MSLLENLKLYMRLTFVAHSPFYWTHGLLWGPHLFGCLSLGHISPIQVNISEHLKHPGPQTHNPRNGTCFLYSHVRYLQILLLSHPFQCLLLLFQPHPTSAPSVIWTMVIINNRHPEGAYRCQHMTDSAS